MILTQGTYENLITDNLLQDMQETTDDGLVCKKEDIGKCLLIGALLSAAFWKVMKLINKRLEKDESK